MNEQKPSPEAERGFDFITFLACSGVSALFAEQAYEALANHIPEAGVAAGGLGTVAVIFGGLAIRQYRFARGYAQHEEQ